MLTAGVLYTFFRCALEFKMQPREIRTWRLAQIDFKLTLSLVVATVPILWAGGLYRSLHAPLWAGLGAAVSLVIWGATGLVLMFVLIPLIKLFRDRRGRPLPSAASSVAEAEGWGFGVAPLVVIVAVSVVFAWSDSARTVLGLDLALDSVLGAVVAFVLTGVGAVLGTPVLLKSLFAASDEDSDLQKKPAEDSTTGKPIGTYRSKER